jgi:hypothetical protein
MEEPFQAIYPERSPRQSPKNTEPGNTSGYLRRRITEIILKNLKTNGNNP